MAAPLSSGEYSFGIDGSFARATGEVRVADHVEALAFDWKSTDHWQRSPWNLVI